MTNQQKNEERLAAWDQYLAAREELLALRSRIGRWIKPLGDIYSRVFSHPENAREDDLRDLPSSEEYATIVREMQQAQTAFSRLRKQAVDFGFTVESDEAISGQKVGRT